MSQSAPAAVALPLQALPGWRASLAEGRRALREAYYARPDPARLLREHSRLVDDVLRALWHEADVGPDACLAAVGGYGRAQLFPHSDVDVLILIADDADTEQAGRIERLVGMLWDIGLEVGHSVRTVAGCRAESARDVTVQTNLMELRRVDGDAELCETLRSALAQDMNPAAFLDAKVKEQQRRHLRFQETAFSLEPNLKESPGGLRDLHNVLWLSQAAGIGPTWLDLAREDVITAREAATVRGLERFLHDLRIRMHYLAGRREDRLLFDYQSALGAQYVDLPDRHRAGELLMQRYYRTAKTVGLLNTILLQNLSVRLHPQVNREAMIIDEHFQQRNRLLEIRDENLFQRRPSTILESLAVLQRMPELTGLSADTLRALWRAKPLINRAFREDPANRARFMELLRAPFRVTDVVRRMNHYGILGRYIPAFGRIVGQMQHDLFHAYTVDEHILKVLRNLRRFSVPAFAHEFPFCSALIEKFERVEVLYVAGLFHDIAKGRGGDHSRLGSVDARRFCRQHGLLEEDTALVAWLVQNHLNMSTTAQKQDLSDPDVILRFAHKVGSERNLTALYLLTVADIRGTSPKVWNAWKGKLLEDLFRATLRCLEGARATMEQEIRARQEDTLRIIRQYALREGVHQELWAQLDDQYFQRHESHEIAWHTRMLRGKVDSREPIVRARLSPVGEGMQVMIYSPDREALFARICNFFEHLNYSIAEARIYTTRHGYALNTFQVLDRAREGSHYRDVLNYIEHELGDRLRREAPLEPPLKGRLSRRVRHFPIAPSVTLQPSEKGGYHVLSITAGDRPGLLYRVARIFLKEGLTLRSAKINTLGERAEDAFVVAGAALDDPERAQALSDALLEQLQT